MRRGPGRLAKSIGVSAIAISTMASASDVGAESLHGFWSPCDLTCTAANQFCLGEPDAYVEYFSDDGVTAYLEISDRPYIDSESYELRDDTLIYSVGTINEFVVPIEILSENSVAKTFQDENGNPDIYTNCRINPSENPVIAGMLRHMAMEGVRPNAEPRDIGVDDARVPLPFMTHMAAVETGDGDVGYAIVFNDEAYDAVEIALGGEDYAIALTDQAVLLLNSADKAKREKIRAAFGVD